MAWRISKILSDVFVESFKKIKNGFISELTAEESLESFAECIKDLNTERLLLESVKDDPQGLSKYFIQRSVNWLAIFLIKKNKIYLFKYIMTGAYLIYMCCYIAINHKSEGKIYLLVLRKSIIIIYQFVIRPSLKSMSRWSPKLSKWGFKVTCRSLRVIYKSIDHYANRHIIEQNESIIWENLMDSLPYGID